MDNKSLRREVYDIPVNVQVEADDGWIDDGLEIHNSHLGEALFKFYIFILYVKLMQDVSK